MEAFGMIVGLLAIAAAVYGINRFFQRHYSKPVPFNYGDETFTWVPAPGARPGLFGHAFEGGSFLYPDGTPVEDAALNRHLAEYWDRQNRPIGVDGT